MFCDVTKRSSEVRMFDNNVWSLDQALAVCTLFLTEWKTHAEWIFFSTTYLDELGLRIQKFRFPLFTLNWDAYAVRPRKEIVQRKVLSKIIML